MFGVHRVARAVSDLIVASRGRVANVSSISGALSSALLGPYGLTKHALEAYTDALAAQLDPLGVHVAAVEPGNYDPAILVDAVRQVPAPAERAGIREPGADLSRSPFPPPGDVAEACHAALFDPHPLRRYMVVPNADEGRRTLRKAAEELVQLNAWSPHALTRRALHALLDEVAAAGAPAG